MYFVAGAGATAGAAAAAAAAKRQREEEEDMTRYNAEDLDGWEFKIVRSNTKKFKKYAAVQQICQEEAKAGWEMMEKFDDGRIRFKRRIEKRAFDRHLDIDPYRTLVGIGEGQLALTIVGVCFLIMGVILGFVFLFKG